MKISIITPSYNQVEFIERTMQSVLSQTGDFELEYIIIDGGSTDGSVDIIKQLANQDARISWVSEADHGQSHAINKGLHQSTGDIVAWLNSDDTYQPGALQTVVTHFSDNPNIMWLTGYCTNIDAHDNAQYSLIKRYKDFWLRHLSTTVLQVMNPISQPATFWRREAHTSIGYINEQERYAMDYEFWWRLWQAFGTPAVIMNTLAAFRIYPDTKSTQHTGQQFKDEIRIADAQAMGWVGQMLHRVHVAAVLLVYRIVR